MSRIGRAIAVLGAGLSGYAKGAQIHQENLDRDEDREFRREQRMHQRKEWAAKDAERDALNRASAPAAVETITEQKPDTMDNRDVGQPGEQPLPPVGFSVMGKRFNDRGSADAAAAAANSPGAVAGRQADVIAKSNPERATQLRVGAMQLQAAQRAEAERAFDDGIFKALEIGPDGLAKFMSDSYADGSEGARKFATERNDKGQWRIVELSDGTKKPISKTWFNDDEQGRITAGFMLSRAVKPEGKLAHMLKMRELDIRDRQVTADETRAKAALTTAQHKALLDRMSEADKTRYSSLLDQQKGLQGEIEKALLGGTVTEDSPQVVNARRRLVDIGLQIDMMHRKYEAPAGAADPLGMRGGGGDAPAAGDNTQTVTDTKVATILADMQKRGVTEASVVLDGRKGKLMIDGTFKDEGPGTVAGVMDKGTVPEKAGKAAETAKGVVSSLYDANVEALGRAKDAASSVASKASEAIGKSTIGRAMKKIADLGVDYTTPEGKRALAGRVAESKAGGPPLTEVEILRAKQAGLI